MTGKAILVVAVIALVSAGAAAGAVYSWQNARITDVENRLRNALDAVEVARDQADGLGSVTPRANCDQLGALTHSLGTLS